MKANVKGAVIPAPVIDGTGYADLFAVLEAFGIPVRKQPQGAPLVALRRFAEALGQPHQYVNGDDIFYIAAKPLPVLPTEPVGAGNDPWRPVTAPICGGPGDRRADLYERIIQQFRVAINPRYQSNHQGKDETYCNIFAWDVTKALGAEIPHWVVGNGEPSSVGTGRELDANAVNAWLRSRGPDHGWRPCNAIDAAAYANQGRPVVASYLNPTGIGHVAVVRPGVSHGVRGVPIAQAGGRNFDDGYLWDGFRAGSQVDFYVHN